MAAITSIGQLALTITDSAISETAESTCSSILYYKTADILAT
jgi:hypothetical protein